MKTTRSRILSIAVSISFIFFGGLSCFADSLDHWHWRNPLPSGNSLNGIAFGNGTFVTVGNVGTLLTSTNGTNWTVSDPLGPTLRRVIFASGKFVAVGDSGSVVTSTNGLNWTFQNSGTSNSLSTVVYGNSLYVAAGVQGTLLVSSNALQWTPVSAGVTNDFGWIAYGNGKFVLPTAPVNLLGGIYGADKILESTDATNWTQEPIPDTGSFATSSAAKIVFNNGKFASYVALYSGSGFSQSYYTSTDGLHWSKAADAPGSVFPGYVPDLLSANDLFFEYMSFPPSPLTNLYSSPDAQTWNAAVTPPNFAINDITYGTGQYVGVGVNGNISASPDGTNWVQISSGPGNRFVSVASGDGIIATVGGAAPYAGQLYGFASPILISSNGVSFFPAPVQNSNQVLADMACNGSTFVTVGESGALQVSTNGLSWTVRPSGSTNHLAGICYGNGIWVAVGADGTVVTSPNGLAWTLRNSGTGLSLFGATYANGQFVAVGDEGTAITSPDGINWTVQYVDTLSALYRITFGNGKFVAVGDNGVITTSPDGVNWTIIGSPTALQLFSVAFGNGEFVAVGSKPVGYYDYEEPNVILRSYDGSTWQIVRPPTDWDLNSVSFFNGAFWVAGGNGSILQSDPVSSAPILLGHAMANNGGVQLTIDGMTGKNVRIQMSGSPNGPWTDAYSVTNTQPLQTWTDTNTVNVTARFYRLVSP